MYPMCHLGTMLTANFIRSKLFRTSKVEIFNIDNSGIECESYKTLKESSFTYKSIHQQSAYHTSILRFSFSKMQNKRH